MKGRLGRGAGYGFLVLWLAVFLLLPGRVLAQEAENEETKKEIPTLCGTMVLYKGEKRYLDVTNVGGISSVSFKSSDKSIVEITKKGRMKAKSCGKAVITVTMKKKQQVSRAQIQVEVQISRLYRSPSYAKAVAVSSSNTKAPLFTFHTQLKAGKSLSIKLKELAKDAQVTYSSNKPKIATVSSKGVVKAKKAGKAIITITVRQNEIRYRFREAVHVGGGGETASISQKEINQWFSKSAFVGNSISEGLEYYFKTQKKGFLGNPKMMTRVSYSFMNDKRKNRNYMIRYKGTPYQARTAIAKSGVKRVFICMGANDLWKAASLTYKDYVEYLEGIRKDNPKVQIFIESTTPVYRGREKGIPNNKTVNALNKYMKKYCSTQKDMYYVDINTPMKDSSGNLRSDYCSDHDIHLTNKAYKQWTETVRAYVEQLLIQEKKAGDAVATAEESRLLSQYKEASKVVKKLFAGAEKDKLSKRLKKIKSSLH